jgi:N-acetylmuramoyl-L-alanine amidase
LIDEVDATSDTRAALEQTGLRVGVTRTLMKTLDDRERVAQAAIELAAALRAVSADARSAG